MRREPSSDPLASRLSRLVDGLLNQAEIAELEALLRRSRAARDYYRHYMSVHLGLAEALPRLAAVSVSRPSRHTRRGALLALAAAFVLLAGSVVYAVMRGGRHTAHDAPLAGTRPFPVLALVAEADHVSWDLPQAPVGGLCLHAGCIKLSSGKLALATISGQTVTVAAPAEIELLDESAMFLHRGQAALRILRQGKPYIIRVPEGAVADMGTEFSVNVSPLGTTDLMVSQGEVLASLLENGSATREELTLKTGQSVKIDGGFCNSLAHQSDYIRPLPVDVVPDSPAGESYAAAVKKARPLAWWRFEQAGTNHNVPDEMGGPPLVLAGSPKIAGTKTGRRFLYTDEEKCSGFARTPQDMDGLNTSKGLTVELLFYSTRMCYGTIFGLQLDGPDGAGIASKNKSHHEPHTLLIERMCRNGETIGHVHPDFAIRGLFRTPAGYRRGTNVYSSEPYLLYRWIHLALTIDASHASLYIDGKLSSRVRNSNRFLGERLCPIIGRMQPSPKDELRQWSGGIDEVALYNRTLKAREIRAHAAALEH